MKFLDGNYYVEVKDYRYNFHPTENIFLGPRDPTNSLRTQNQEQKNTQIRKNQKVNKNDNDELKVKSYPKKKQATQQQPNFKPPNCTNCEQNNWLEIDKV